MPGRQSTGPIRESVVKQKQKKGAKSRGLNALAIAEKQIPQQPWRRGNRLGQVEEDGTKRKRNDREDAPKQDHTYENRVKRLRAGDKDEDGHEVDGGSDSEGNEWVLGRVNSDDDSEIDSDEAMGSEDEKIFEGFAFRGSSGKPSRGPKRTVDASSKTASYKVLDLEEDEGLENDSGNESESFRDLAVDLDTMLEGEDAMSSDRDEDGSHSQENDGKGDDADTSSGDGSLEADEEPDESILSVSDDVEADTNYANQVTALQTFITGMTEAEKPSKGQRDDFATAQEAMTPSEFGLTSRKKITVAELLPTVTDPLLRKSLRLMVDDGKRPKKADGIPQKLDVPLPRRQQERLDRAAAYEKSKETLSRWMETVKHNRRAEHLMFPLQDHEAVSVQSNSNLSSTVGAKPTTSLEVTIQNILLESGLTPANADARIQAAEELATNKMPLEEVQARRAELRKARELLFREEIRARRIKKIKSKSYRRVHRRERQRNLLRHQEALVAAGLEASEDEQETLDRKRAEERMGARHRDSKWAKAIKRTGQATWDSGTRDDVNEMARREEELKKRIQGKNVGTFDVGSDSSDSGSRSEMDDDEEEDDDDKKRKHLSSQLDRLSEGGRSSGSRLSSLKFMQVAEAAQKTQNDADINRMRKELMNEEESELTDQDELPGRRAYQPHGVRQSNSVAGTRNEFEEPGQSEDDVLSEGRNENEEVEIINNQDARSARAPPRQRRGLSTTNQQKMAASQGQPTVEENPWLVLPKATHGKRRDASASDNTIMITTNPSEITQAESRPSELAPSLKKSKPSGKSNSKSGTDTLNLVTPSSPTSSFGGFSPSPPPPATNAELIARAFAGDDVLATFTDEKEAQKVTEAPQTSSTALPGWGGWVGVGLTKRDKAHAAAQVKRAPVQVTAGTNPEQRRDAAKGMQRVIISEARMKKNDRFLATSLPFPFETKVQYERSLRLPVGPEWTTKETFQEATQPRVILKQGVITPMKKPMI